MTDTAAADPTADAPRAQTDAELRREWATLTADNRRMDAQKRENSRRLRDIQDRVLQTFVDRGESAVVLVGLGNLHVEKSHVAKIRRDDDDYTRDPTAAERDRARRCLQAAGLGDMIKANFTLQSVTAWYNELAQDGKHPPEEMHEGFYFEDGHKLGLTAK